MVCETKLIDDRPPREDDLALHEGEGAHERIARAIADLIRLSGVGGKLIGLEGGWGSGKSTVIHLMRTALDNAKDTTVFIFDSWAHEREPLRRSFLESLIGQFQRDKWIGGALWNAEIERLANRRTVTQSRTGPRTTPFGTRLAFSALFVPFGTAWVAASFADGLRIEWLAPINWGQVLSVLLCVSPALVVCWHRFTVVRTNRRTENARATENDWTVLAGGSTRTTTESFATPEPTSVEFEAIFRRLMEAVVGEDNGRRVVLVLDNLDRVNAEDARKLWSTLQIFLQYRRDGIPEWFKNVWIVVPYDKSGLRLLWANSDAAQENDGTRTPAGVPESFIDRSLQIHFEVPPPVLSNWRGYLVSLVGESMPGHTEEANDLYRIYLHCVAKRDGIPTPRQLKLYVNQIAALHLQWGCAEDVFPIRHLAYYAALRRANWTSDQLRKRLVDEEAVPWETGLAPILTDNLRANLAGLLFNVTADVGEQLLLTEPILGALSTADGGRLADLKRIHKDGFWAVLDDVISSHVSLTDPETMCSAIVCLNGSGLLEDVSKEDVSRVIRATTDLVLGIPLWSTLTERTIPAIGIACSLAKEPEVSQRLLDGLSGELAEHADKIRRTVESGQLIEQLVDLIKRLHKLKHKAVPADRFVIAGDAEEWIENCAQIAKQPERMWGLFTPVAPFVEILRTILRRVETDQMSDGIVSAIGITNKSGVVATWEPLVDAIDRKLREPDVRNQAALKSARGLLVE